MNTHQLTSALSRELKYFPGAINFDRDYFDNDFLPLEDIILLQTDDPAEAFLNQKIKGVRNEY